MTTQQISYFFTVAASHTYSEAAEILQISPSALSKSIKNLEDELNVVLFTKENNNISMTTHAQWLFPHLQYIFAQCSSMERTALQYANSMSSTVLQIGSMFFAKYYHLTSLTEDLHANNPNLSISLSEIRANELNTKLHSRALHGAFIYRELLNHSCKRIVEIKKEPIVALMRKELADTLGAETQLRELSDRQYLLMRGDTLLHNYLQRICIDVGFVPLEAPLDLRLDTIAEMLRSSDMISLVPKAYADNMKNRKNLQTVALTDVPPLTFCFALTSKLPHDHTLILEQDIMSMLSHFSDNETR